MIMDYQTRLLVYMQYVTFWSRDGPFRTTKSENVVFTQKPAETDHERKFGNHNKTNKLL